MVPTSARRVRAALVLTLLAQGAAATCVCENTCAGGPPPAAQDGVCNDGGDGAVNSICSLGTDCDDCGRRGISPAAPPLPPPSPLPPPAPPLSPPQTTLAFDFETASSTGTTKGRPRYCQPPWYGKCRWNSSGRR